ncbi:MAG: flap endonuclease-1 [Candidatus Micrarchaeia archaeon]
MAVDISKLVSEVKESIELQQLSGKRIAIDAYNTIYQFLSIIRQPDGTPLVDSKNRVTSHLSGLFYRTISMMQNGITPIYVFDGTPPPLKAKTIEARMNRREEAYKEWQKAKAKGMEEEARVHAMASTRINKEIVESSKELLRLMGVAYIQAPSEGEAQAARMVQEGLAYAAASQDYDLFLFGAERVVRNLTITGRRKLPRKNVYIEVQPELALLSKLLEKLQITRRQLVWLGMLIGTDFNEGIKGVGPMTALKIAKSSNSLDEVSSTVKSKYGVDLGNDAHEVEEIFMNPDTSEIDKAKMSSAIKDSKPDKRMLIKFMCDEHGFSEERISKFADLLLSIRSAAGQKGISDWF